MNSANNQNSTRQNNNRQNNSRAWKDWAVAAQGGDRKAYHHLLKEIAPFIRNFLIGGLANPDWADDITQEVLISVHKSLSTFSPDRPFTPWLMAIIKFRRTDFLRKHYRGQHDKTTDLEDVNFQKQHVTNPQSAGEYKDIEQALDGLPDKQRKIVELMKIKGYTAKEVANQLGMTESAVKVSAHRSLGKLKKQLGEV